MCIVYVYTGIVLRNLKLTEEIHVKYGAKNFVLYGSEPFESKLPKPCLILPKYSTVHFL